MKRIFYDFLTSQAIKLALRRPAPQRIPRTLPKAIDVDCFVVQIGDDKNKWLFLGESSNSKGIEGYWWDGDSYNLPCSISFESISSRRVEITHYINVYEFNFTSPIKFLLFELCCVVKLKILKEKIYQAFFNRKKLIRMDRISVLRLALEESIKNKQFYLSSTVLMSLLYSNRWVFHPDKDELLRYCSFLLTSLSSSGDLVIKDGFFVIEGKALATIAEYEEDYRRHRDNPISQKILAALTVGMVIVGIAQVYLAWIHP